MKVLQICGECLKKAIERDVRESEKRHPAWMEKTNPAALKLTEQNSRTRDELLPYGQVGIIDSWGETTDNVK